VEGANSLLDLLIVLAENVRLLFFWALAPRAIALGTAFLITPTFAAAAQIRIPQQQRSTAALLVSEFSAMSGLSGVVGLNRKNPADLCVGLIRSRTVADRIIDRVDLMRVYGEEFGRYAYLTLERAPHAALR